MITCRLGVVSRQIWLISGLLLLQRTLSEADRQQPHR